MKKFLSQYKKPLVAFSGGSDSLFLLSEIIKYCPDFLVVHLLMPNGEDVIDKKIFNVSIEKVEFNPLEIKEFRENSKNRCYYCKKNMFLKLKEIARENNCDVIFDGTNYSDNSAYRPGLKALEEEGIVSPLKILGYTKSYIQSQLLNMNIIPKPSNSCYATRIEYNEEITLEKLEKIKTLENYLKSLGVSLVRCGIHRDLLRIDCPKEEHSLVLKSDIVKKALELGFKYVTLDLEGFVSGKQDR